ncbi:MAG TPA: hypothetical protein VJ803_10915 [Gemmatimonadaceae bacterium]|nr:hypothetical protein [Gemmatimonadaceae bacterium]
MNRRAVAAIAAIAAIMACAPLGSGGGGVEPGNGSPGRGDRVLVTAFNDVLGVAAGRRIVYAATSNGVIGLDRQFQRWLPPLTEGVDIGIQSVTAMAVDPLDEAVWYATPGRLVRYEPTIDLLTSTIVPGPVDVIMFDARDPGAGAFIRAGGRWYNASRFGMASPVDPSRLPPPDARVLPPTLRQLYTQFPSLQSFSALITRDDWAQSWPVSSGAKAPEATEVWLGTRGNGLFKVDPVFNTSDHVIYGLLSPIAGALAAAEGGVWIASAGRSYAGRGGLTYASSDLQQWRWIEGSALRPMADMRARDLSIAGRIAWIASDRGLVRIDVDRQQDHHIWSATHGLPDDRVLSVASSVQGAWVGTARGLAFVAEQGEQGAPGAPTRTLLRGIGVRALALVGDTLWIGTDAGLMTQDTRTPGSSPQRARASGNEPRLTRAVYAIARSDSMLVVALDDGLVALSLPSRAPIARLSTVATAGVGRVAAMDADADGILLAGSAGALVVDRATGATQLLSAPRDIPAEALDVLLEREWAWIATPAGIVRLRRVGGRVQ